MLPRGRRLRYLETYHFLDPGNHSEELTLMTVRIVSIARLFMMLTAGLCVCLGADTVPKTGTRNGWKQHDAGRPKPPVVEPAASPMEVPPPRGAVILFDGSNLDSWQTAPGHSARWKVADGQMEIVPGSGEMQTKAAFGDVQLHLEWAAPAPPVGKGQDRGNSGIFFMGLYELQILDSYRADTYTDGQVAAIYGQYPPLFNASRPPGEWQTYDVAFRRPRFDRVGKLVEPARLTVVHNGILVQNNEEILGPTRWLRWDRYEQHEDRAPIKLQDHGHTVRFRNIWLVNLPERPAPTAHALERVKPLALDAAALDRYVGGYAASRDRDAAIFTVTRGDGHLNLTPPGIPSHTHVLLPVTRAVFEMPDSDVRMTFQTSEEAPVTTALFTVGGEERTLTRVKEQPTATATIQSEQKGPSGPLRIIVFGAHPDDCELEAGGTAARWSSLGYKVKFVSVTNGDIGHHELAGAILARRRTAEVKKCAEILGIETEVLDIHDGELLPTLENRRIITRKIREWQADVVIAHRPTDYHPDHRYTGILVQDAAFMVIVPSFCPDVPALRKNPVFLYTEDDFKKPNPFTPDVVVPIDPVFEKKVACVDGLASQFYEWNPWLFGYLGEVPKESSARMDWTRDRVGKHYSGLADRFRPKLIELLGQEKGQAVKYAESFEVCEYGTQPSRAELLRIFPFFEGK
jgi:N-acetylglucosamine malate deacetylase 1